MHGTARLLLLLACVYGLSYTIGHKLQVAHTELLSLAPDDAVNSSPSWIPYLELYQNVHSLAGRIAFLSGLTIWLLFLFSFIGIVASDFFCPNLSTISSKLGLSESVAGSTLLAFGNGSPDVFSTFAAMSANSGSLAIGELLGAAAFIVSVVAGIMTLVKPFKVARHSFLRDVGFFTMAVALMLVILWDKVITRTESALMVLLYVLYVITVAATSWWHGRRERIREGLRRAREEYAEEEVTGTSSIAAYRDASPEDSLVSSSRASPRFMPLHYTPLDEDEILEITERSSPITLTASNPTRPDGRQRAHSVAGTGLGRRTKTRNTAVRPSLLGAIEFRDVVNSLAESSGANALSVFGNLDGPREGRQSSRYSVGGRSLSQLPDAALDHERPDSPRSERPTHRRAISTAGITPTRQSDFDPSIWDRSPRSSKSQVDLIDLSEGVENPWKSSPTAASPLLPRQLLKIDTHVGQSDAVSASPLPITPLPQQSKVIRKVPSIVLVNESGQATPVTLLSPPETPTGLRIPKWMVSSGRRRRKVRMVLTALRGALFPSLADFRKKSIVASFLALVSAPAILVLVITLPVVDEEADQEDACMDEKDIVVSHHTLTAGADEPVDDGRDEEEHQGWQERARLRNEHIAHVMHSPAAFHHHSSDSYSRPLDLHSVDVELVRDQYFPDQDPPPEISIQSPQASRQYLLNGGPSPPASVRADLDQCAVDLKVGDALVLLQCALSPFFVVMALLGDELELWYLLVAAGFSMALCLIATAICRSPKRTGKVFFCLVGFVVSMVWLLSCVNEVVGVLQAMGHVFGLSDAILGVTVFALGNSTADLVANYTIARMGYPVMAISACYGGPLLNMLLGVGISGSYFIAKSGQPYYIDFDVTLITTCSALLVLLIITLIFIPYNGYLMSRQWGFFLIGFYLCLATLNVAIEVKRERTHKHHS